MSSEKYIYVGDFEILFMGRIEELNIHSHITWTLCFSLEGSYSYISNQESITTKKAILIPPKVSHRIIGKNSKLIFIFFEKYSSFIQNKALETKVQILELNRIDKLIDSFKEIIYWESETKKNIEILIKELKIPIPRKEHLDPRIEKALKILKTKQLEDDIAAKELASIIHLSESRFSHLFKKEIGIPISSYKIWIKIKRLANSLQRGESLTYAAHDSGFYDSSHLNRVFKNYFGINPKNVFSNSTVHWI